MTESRRLLQHFVAALAYRTQKAENFIFATIDTANVSPNQALPNAPDPGWHGDEMPRPPGPRRIQRDSAS